MAGRLNAAALIVVFSRPAVPVLRPHRRRPPGNFPDLNRAETVLFGLRIVCRLFLLHRLPAAAARKHRGRTRAALPHRNIRRPEH